MTPTGATMRSIGSQSKRRHRRTRRPRASRSSWRAKAWSSRSNRPRARMRGRMAGSRPRGGPSMNALEALSQAKDVINVRRVYGGPYQENGLTIIPAANVTGGGGGGGDPAGNGGAGFGVRAKPAGAWVIKDGEATWRPAFDLNRTVLFGQLIAIVALLVTRSIVKTLAKANR